MKTILTKNVFELDSDSQERLILTVMKALSFEFTGPYSLIKAPTDWGNKDEGYFKFLVELIELSKKDFKAFGDQLIAQLQTMLDADEIFPLNEARLDVLKKVFEDYSLKIQFRFSGLPDGEETTPLFKQFENAGLIEPKTNYIDLSYRLGKYIQGLSLQGKKGKYPPLKELVTRSQEPELTPIEIKALKFIKRSGANRIRPIADTITGAMSNVIESKEKQLVRRMMREKIEERIPTFKLASEMRKTALEENIATSRNYQRVARTEMVEAFGQGGYSEIVRQYAGLDPWVFKDVAKTACKHCKRIWGDKEPKLYKLSEIAGNPTNEGVSPGKWVAQIGVIHPNCTEGFLLVDTQKTREEQRKNEGPL